MSSPVAARSARGLAPGTMLGMHGDPFVRWGGVRLALPLALALASGACKGKEEGAGAAPSARAVGSDAGTAAPAALVVTPTANFLPAELEGVAIGMTVDELRAARAGKPLEVERAVVDATAPELDETMRDAELLAELDRAKAARERVTSPDWKGTEGLYYLSEALVGPPNRRAEYTLRDGVLRQVLVTLDSPASAAAVARGLLGVEASPRAPWSTPADGQRPALRAWAHEDRYVLRATGGGAAPTDGAGAGPSGDGATAPAGGAR